MPDLQFLRTEQKNERIQHSNLDMSHKNLNSYNLGELKVSQNEPILPTDSAELRVNDEIICQPLENPAFSKYKLCHKTFYMPYCNLWKYWNNFITEKPDFTWTNSAIQQFIESNQPYTPPYFTWSDILPIIAFARGFIKNAKIVAYPVMDSSSDDFLYMDFANTKIVFQDLNNMGTNPSTAFGDTSYSRVGLRVLSDTNWNLFDNNGDDLTIPSLSDTEGSYFSTQLLASLSSNLRVKKSSNDSYIDQSFASKLRFAITFDITQEKSCDISVLNTSINDQDFYYLHIDNVTVSNTVSLSTVGVNRNVYVLPITGSSSQSNKWILPLPAGFECSQYRMSMLSYLWYLCNNAVKLLDSMSIPVYIPELFNVDAKFDALPFFAYSRIYHEYFANKQIQVNAPDWSEANGPLCPQYDNTDLPYNHYQFGWSLHHPEIPYNVVSFNYDEKLVIRNWFQGCCLLLGLRMNDLLYSNVLDNSQLDSVWLRTNKSLSHTYMVYNGLLHLQYVNFPSDYFTEALLDPLAGAKDINIPTTITQLQEKSKLQDFLNQTAWTRNIKEWLQSQWDSFSKFTTVNEPSLCGSSDVDINISQVLQTSETATTPLGTRAGIGSGYGNGYLCKQQFGEYGVLLTLSYIVLDCMYINRLDVRQRAKASRFDYPLPQFANLGNESISPSELNFMPYRVQAFGFNLPFLNYVSDTAQVPGFKTTSLASNIMSSYSQSNGQFLPDNSEPQTVQPGLQRVFGYIPRYSIYKHHMDEVHGDFLTTLKRWVPSRELNRHPTYLNYVFISYELASNTSNLLKNFVNTTPFGDDNFLVNHTNILHMRRALPYIVKPQL